jgi:hypothetical protein
MKGQKIWVPLDPSFKQHEKIEGLDLSSIIDIDTEASIEGFKDGIIVSDKLLSVSRVNVQSVSEKIENVDAKIEEFINQKDLEKIKSEELIGGKRIIPQDLDMLPLSLPYKVDAVYEKTSVVPKELRENISAFILLYALCNISLDRSIKRTEPTDSPLILLSVYLYFSFVFIFVSVGSLYSSYHFLQ